MGVCKVSGKRHTDDVDEASETGNYDLAYDVKKELIAIYIENNCRSCKKALKLLTSVNLKPTIFNITAASNPKSLKKALRKFTGDASAPYIFITGKYFGGIHEIDNGIKTHTIQRMINTKLESMGSRLF